MGGEKYSFRYRLGRFRFPPAKFLKPSSTQAALDSDGTLGKAKALALATTNLEKIFGFHEDPEDDDLVAFQGGDMFSLESKVVAIVSPRAGHVEIF
jgi:hypothetical protein